MKLRHERKAWALYSDGEFVREPAVYGGEVVLFDTKREALDDMYAAEARAVRVRVTVETIE